MIHLLPIAAIFAVAYSNVLSKFYSRKLVHMGCGLVLAKVSYPKGPLKYVILAIAAASVLVCFLRPYPFAEKGDVGVISYNATVFLFVVLNLPLRILLPMFVIDPMASIVGRNLRSPVWVHTKTVRAAHPQVFGSLACLVFAYFTLFFVTDPVHRVALSLALTLTEGLLKRFDNLGIIALLTAYYLLAVRLGFPLDLEFKLP